LVASTGAATAIAGLVCQPWAAARERQRDVTASCDASSSCLSLAAWASALAFLSAAACAAAGDGFGKAALATLATPSSTVAASQFRADESMIMASP
jgi:hypothetical protein